MKMTPDHFAELKTAIEPLDTAERRAKYLAGDFPRAERCKDLNMRYRWDLYWLARNPDHDSYLNDTHIDTALRRIVINVQTPIEIR